jgi:hypothetical protein
MAYACLAETAILAMEGRFEDYTLGRNITIERVKEIYQLFKKHQFQLAGLRSFGAYLTDEDVALNRGLAERLRAAPRCWSGRAPRLPQISSESRRWRKGAGIGQPTHPQEWLARRSRGVGLHTGRHPPALLRADDRY